MLNKLKPLFKAEDFDYESQTIIRREILPSGKSRAFVNDSPVNLSSLQLLGERLIDIHSQHQTLQLTSNDFQFQVIDALAKNDAELQKYQQELKAYKILQKEYQELLKFQAEAIKEHDYNAFLLNELEEANLIAGEVEDLEKEYETLNNIEGIKENLAEAYQLLSEEQVGVLSALTALKNVFQKLSGLSTKYQDLFNRANSSLIDMDDLFSEVDELQEDLEADPNRLEVVDAKLKIPQLKKQLEAILVDLGMPNAQFKMDVEFSDTFHTNGKDILSFLFSANKGGHFNELKKAASGGELSRIMLAIKSVLAKYIQLPTIMFDEIDTGVSGEISNKMGDIMLQMSQTMQVFSITHLPQIAAKGHSHFKVYKEDVNDRTQTNLIKLNHDDRIVEIAQMLGGSDMSTSAIAHAKELLN